jgi:hypothetical protein
MAIRRPLYLDNDNNLVEMTATHLVSLRTNAIRQYALNPSVLLTYDAAGTPGTSIGTLTDSRLQAGASTTDISNFDTEAETPEPSFITITWDRVASSLTSVPTISHASNGFPLYWNGTNIQSMNAADIRDTIINPAIDRMTSGSSAMDDAGGTYFVSTTTSEADGTLVSASPIFTDTRANAAAYSAASIPEPQDQPTNAQSYYLFRRNAPNLVAVPRPVYMRADGSIQDYIEADWDNRLAFAIRTTARSDTGGYAIRYHLDDPASAGGTGGTAMVNTRLSGDQGSYQTRYVNTNDYRTQEFPFGTAQTDNTYALKVRKS